jgi:hypothetical protein
MGMDTYQENTMSEKAKHTVGPWRAKKSPHQMEWSHWIMAEKIMVAAATTCSSGDEQDANANLITAAPDLLKAAKGALRELEARADQGWKVNPYVFAPLRDAIAKAEGRAS